MWFLTCLLDHFLPTMTPIHIAITGCGHGELDCFYRMCNVFEKKGKKIDVLIITGDFQAVRNQEDLGSMQCPVKYKHMVDFDNYVINLDGFL